MSDNFFQSVSDDFKRRVHQADIENRMAVLELAFERLKAIFDSKRVKSALSINLVVLRNLVTSYWYDIERAKHFHGMERINLDKKAAYMIKWILRHRPIYFHVSSVDDYNHIDDDSLSKLLCINEIFALRIGLGYAEMTSDMVTASQMHALLYEMYYRDFTVGMLSQWFATVRKVEAWKEES